MRYAQVGGERPRAAAFSGPARRWAPREGSGRGAPPARARRLVALLAVALLAEWGTGRAQDSIGPTARVSVATGGGEANRASSSPSISGDGRWAAFESTASNLDPRDPDTVSDVFVRDRQSSATELVSLATGGSPANGPSFLPSISADGNLIAFHSTASDLVGGDTNLASDVFVRDRQAADTLRVSVGSGGIQGNNASFFPSIAGGGRFVAFESLANNLVPGDANSFSDIFVHDLQTRATTVVSRASDKTSANESSSKPSISSSGRLVAFESFAWNLVIGDTNDAFDVFVWDRQTDITKRVSVSSGGGQADSSSSFPSISADGNVVAFASSASNLVVGDNNETSDVFVHDQAAGTTTRVSIATDGSEGNNSSRFPSISADGRFVAFISEASNLVTRDDNNSSDIFVHDRQSAATVRVSVA
ncbi:MAG: TolB family protein [Actinomycetota bacterium]